MLSVSCVHYTLDRLLALQVSLPKRLYPGMYLPGNPVTQRLVQPFPVVEREVGSRTPRGEMYVFVILQVDLSVLHGSPKMLDEDVVEASPPASRTAALRYSVLTRLHVSWYKKTSTAANRLPILFR